MKERLEAFLNDVRIRNLIDSTLVGLDAALRDARVQRISTQFWLNDDAREKIRAALPEEQLHYRVNVENFAKELENMLPGLTAVPAVDVMLAALANKWSDLSCFANVRRLGVRGYIESPRVSIDYGMRELVLENIAATWRFPMAPALSDQKRLLTLSDCYYRNLGSFRVASVQKRCTI